MRRLLLSVMAGSLLTLSAAGAASAAGPNPDSSKTWDPCPDPPYCHRHIEVNATAAVCTTNSGATGHWLWNNRSGQAHCFGD